jgi:energy-coupling factor transport system ATP-binding protein
VIAITHDIDFCAEHFERGILMADGAVLLDGPIRDVLSRADILAGSYVEPPQVMRLAMKLEIDCLPLTVTEFVSGFEEDLKETEPRA